MASSSAITPRGKDLLEKELNYLTFTRRPQISDEIARAREFGDLKENSEYHAAREEQSHIEARITEIRGKLNASEVIDLNDYINLDSVVFGSSVTYLDEGTGEEKTIRLTGVDEVQFDSKDNVERVNYLSPLAQAIMGKKVGSTGTLRHNDDEITLKVLKIDFTPEAILDYNPYEKEIEEYRATRKKEEEEAA